MAQRNTDKPAVLIAEDEEINRTILREILKDKYRILEAENGNQAVFFIQAERQNIALIILDIHMPKLDGFGVMDYLVENGLNEKIPVIVTTSDQSSDVLLQGRKNKVADIIYKPFRASDIRKHVDTLVSLCKVEQNLDEIIKETGEYLTSQYDMIKKAKVFKIGKTDETIRSIVNKVLPDNEEHNLRIRAYTEILCENVMKRYPQYGLTKSSVRTITESSVIHDIGKVIIPDEVFDRNDPSAHRGLLQIRRRPVAAGEVVNLLLSNTSHQAERKCCYDICRYMYERFDGKGYPEGLSEQEIPISAQIVGIVHRYDEIRFPDPTRILSHKLALRQLLEAEYRSFNPDLADLFEELSDEIEEASEKHYTNTDSKEEK